jgi:DNA-binding LacI/PurR family transcriptional regulator/signal transduction histidine kinase/DNA-binding NarL/FixJ family response regulator
MSAQRRYTIGLGFLFDYLSESYSFEIFRSVQEVCLERGLNFLGFEGGNSRFSTFGLFHKQKNAVIDLLDAGRLDGMILLAEQVTNTLTDPEIKRLKRNLTGVPIVSIGAMSGVRASLLVDNRRGVRELVAHLIERHGRRHIAFINGPATSLDARQRCAAYRRTLESFGLPVDERLIAAGDFYSGATDAVRTILDERRARCDAIVCANDMMAVFAVKELERRGIRVPEDVAVAGFDDIEDCVRVSPRLTTVRQSFRDIGRESVRIMSAVLAGEKVERNVVLPTKMIVRESCGCTDLDALDAVLRPASRAAARPSRPAPGPTADPAGRLLAQLREDHPRLLEKPDVRKTVGELQEILSIGGIGNGGGRKFLFRLQRLAARLLAGGEELNAVYALTASFFAAAAPQGGRDNGGQLAALREEAMVLLGLVGRERLGEGGERIAPKGETRLTFNEDFRETLNVDQLRDIMYVQLMKLKFRRFYVCLYTDGTRRNSRLLMQCAVGEDAPPPDRRPFPSRRLLPGILGNAEPFAFIVAALYFKETGLGYMLSDISGLTLEPLFDTLSSQLSGAVNGAIQAKAIHDHTEQLEEKVRERTMRLELATREKTNLFVSIAHDVKTPLTLIRNYLDGYVKKHGPSDELRVIRRHFEKLLDVMVDYLDREKIERGKITYRHDQVADFSGLLREDLELFRETARRGNVRLRADIAPGVSLRADPKALARIVSNLLENALRFAGPGGQVSVALGRRRGTIEFAVADSGIGLTAEEAKIIFDPYVQIGDASGAPLGIGMGLSIVKNIMDSLGGRISVVSRKGKGAEFTCVFPNAPAARGRGAPGGAAPRRRSARAPAVALAPVAYREDRYTLLFVEDDPELLAYLVANTREMFNVYWAGNGVEALQRLKDGPKPDLIVSDVVMDKMDGHRLIETLQRDGYTRDIPFIFLTAVNSREERIRGLRQGAVDYIGKPFSTDELIAKIDSLIRIQQALKNDRIRSLGTDLFRLLERMARRKSGFAAAGGNEDGDALYAKYGISRQEIEVISLLKLGLRHKEIAFHLGISINTVRTYVARIYDKCKVNTLVELLKKLKSL